MEFICGSAISIFVCFVVVLVGSSHAAATLRESIFELGEHSVHPLLVVHVVDQSLAEDASHDLQIRRVEMQPRIYALVRPQKGRLKCEAIN